MLPDRALQHVNGGTVDRPTISKKKVETKTIKLSDNIAYENYYEFGEGTQTLRIFYRKQLPVAIETIQGTEKELVVMDDSRCRITSIVKTVPNATDLQVKATPDLCARSKGFHGRIRTINKLSEEEKNHTAKRFGELTGQPSLTAWNPKVFKALTASISLCEKFMDKEHIVNAKKYPGESLWKEPTSRPGITATGDRPVVEAPEPARLPSTLGDKGRPERSGAKAAE